MSALLSILTVLLRALLPAAAKAAKDTAEDGSACTTKGDALRLRIASTWGLVLCCLLCAGCFTRTIYVPHGAPVRLREPITNAKVWVMDKTKTPVEGTMTLPEGWYALPMPDTKEQ